MSRTKNDGKGRMGGRQKGTPNKATADLRGWIAQIICNGRERFADSLNSLEPHEYVRVFTTLINYIVPKQQAESVEARIEAEYRNMERLLDVAPDEAIDCIAERLLDIKTMADGNGGEAGIA